MKNDKVREALIEDGLAYLSRHSFRIIWNHKDVPASKYADKENWEKEYYKGKYDIYVGHLKWNFEKQKMTSGMARTILRRHINSKAYKRGLYHPLTRTTKKQPMDTMVPLIKSNKRTPVRLEKKKRTPVRLEDL